MAFLVYEVFQIAVIYSWDELKDRLPSEFQLLLSRKVWGTQLIRYGILPRGTPSILNRRSRSEERTMK